MKPVNLRFYRDSLYIALLDCDGFSIQGEGERFPAGQFTPDYLAPEFQRIGQVPGEQEEAQDRFSLAVIIFQLLNHGIHPFSGRSISAKVPDDLPGRIAAGCYAYGINAAKSSVPVPAVPTICCRLSCVSCSIAHLAVRPPDVLPPMNGRRSCVLMRYAARKKLFFVIKNTSISPGCRVWSARGKNRLLRE